MPIFKKTVEAMRNVVENAVRFTAQGAITITIKKEGDFGITEVADTGPGIDASVLSKLFSKELVLSGRPAGKGEGTGLGLYIAKSFMQLQQSDISFRSKPGTGSTFVFKLPLFQGSFNE